jgi:hypothetical protein
MLDIKKLRAGARTARAGLLKAHLMFSVGLLSPLAGFMAATQLKLTGLWLVDGLLLTIAPWVFWKAVFKGITKLRTQRFGADSEPALDTGDLFVAVGATLVGPYLLYTFMGQAITQKDQVSIFLVVMGAAACATPIYRLAHAVIVP